MRGIDLTEGRDGPLYHAMMQSHFVSAIKNDRILGTVIHKYDPSGKIILDPELHTNYLQGGPDYRSREEKLNDPTVSDRVKANIRRWEESSWYLGISLTRSLKFVSKWKDVILELDHAALAARYKILPKQWGSNRKEAEEFLVLKRNIEKDYVDFANPNESNPKVAPLSRYLTGIYLSFFINPNDPNKDEGIRLAEEHPLFKGYLRNHKIVGIKPNK